MSSVSALIRKYTLANAFSHSGKANPGAIIGKLIAEDPKFKKEIKNLQPEIQKTVQEVNALSLEDQEAELQKVFPEFFEEKPREERELPELSNAKDGKVVTRLAPEPNGHLHIGHAVSFFFNHYYARKYHGKLILRFEDTNPEKEEAEYYAEIQKDLDWLQIDYDERKNNSDDIPKFYELAEQLIQKKKAYVCTCPVEKSRKARQARKVCKCRGSALKETKALWTEMLTDAKPGSMSLRFKGDMEAKNTVMRDPTIFRIVTAEHPLQKTKYRVWPLYDFANAIEDALCGVTHVLRSSEFIQRDELQDAIRTALGFKNPEIISYSRTRIEGSPTSKREIVKLLENGFVTGWDDPRLVTLQALKRRGISTEALRNLAYQIRLSRSEKTIDWHLIIAESRKVLDAQANRYSFVADPVKLKVARAPQQNAELALHPSFPDRGVRSVTTDGIFQLAADDMKRITKGESFRLKDLYNVRVNMQSDKLVEGAYDSDVLKPGVPKFQWVAGKGVPVEVQIPGILLDPEGNLNPNSLQTVTGLGEEAISKLEPGVVVQFERFGFVKLEHVSKEKVTGILTHK